MMLMTSTMYGGWRYGDGIVDKVGKGLINYPSGEVRAERRKKKNTRRQLEDRKGETKCENEKAGWLKLR